MMVMMMATTPSVNASRRPLVIVALRFLGARIIRRGARPDNGVQSECLTVGNRWATLQGGWGRRASGRRCLGSVVGRVLNSPSRTCGVLKLQNYIAVAV